jgi:ABC-type bacteriocin/lantibiotic exporter with double-glycine peptidase domain
MFVGTPHFRASYQQDDFSCGARSTYAILRHFGKKVKYSVVKTQCLTTEANGTNVQSIVGVLRFYGLMVAVRPGMSIRGLRNALKQGAVMLVHVDDDHFAVVYGRDRKHTYIADPNRRHIRKHLNAVFKERWNKWALTVRLPKE